MKFLIDNELHKCITEYLSKRPRGLLLNACLSLLRELVESDIKEESRQQQYCTEVSIELFKTKRKFLCIAKEQIPEKVIKLLPASVQKRFDQLDVIPSFKLSTVKDLPIRAEHEIIDDAQNLQNTKSESGLFLLQSYADEDNEDSEEDSIEEVEVQKGEEMDEEVGEKRKFTEFAIIGDYDDDDDEREESTERNTFNDTNKEQEHNTTEQSNKKQKIEEHSQ